MSEVNVVFDYKSDLTFKAACSFGAILTQV